MFETFALRLAIESDSLRQDDLAPLARLVVQMDAAGKTGDRVTMMEHDLDFHRALCELSGSPRLLDLYDQTRLLRLLVFTISQLPHFDLNVLGQQHRQIVDALGVAIEQHDPAPAIVALERHLDGSCQLAMRQIAQAAGEEGEPE
jgi:DNA-binding GntR family transcriptional regulator